MTSSFVRSLIFDGRLQVGAEAHLVLDDADRETLDKALKVQCLHLPGPSLERDLPTLVLAVQVVYRMAWRFLNSELTPVPDDLTLRMPEKPRSAAEHLAADVAFRFLPGLYQRVLHRDPEDPLGIALRELLRQWPLSGVLADITEPPLVPIDFGGHVGLGFLYAQRLAERERHGWQPDDTARESLELVYHALGKKAESDPKSL